jgi:DNA modification methylase
LRQAFGQVDAGWLYAFSDWRMWPTLLDLAESSGYATRAMIVWDKGSPGMGHGWRAQHELVLCGVRPGSKFELPDGQGNVIQCARTGNELHTTEKPVELLARILQVTSNAATVYDPFLGSGTTLIAAETLGRTCYGMEIEPRYVDVAVRRWINATGGEAIRESDGVEFHPSDIHREESS